jgi:hypothetical protein
MEEWEEQEEQDSNIYGLAHFEIPKHLEKYKFKLLDQQDFSEIAWQVDLSDEQAQKLWDIYNERSLREMEGYHREYEEKIKTYQADAIQAKEAGMDGMMISKEEAMALISKHTCDKDGAYLNIKGQHTQEEHDRLVALVNRCYEIINSEEGYGTLSGYLEDLHKDHYKKEPDIEATNKPIKVLEREAEVFKRIEKYGGFEKQGWKQGLGDDMLEKIEKYNGNDVKDWSEAVFEYPELADHFDEVLENETESDID